MASGTDPGVNMEITIGSLALNCVLIPDIGISSKIVPEELRTIPAQSILASFTFRGSGGIVCGDSRKYSAIATTTASDEMK